jgi:DNA-binding transcriptional regulator YiaG
MGDPIGQKHFGKPLTPADVREWRESLGLSNMEAGVALNLNNPNATLRDWQSGRDGKAPAPPTALLMDMTATVVLAVIQLRSGQADEARDTLQRILTAPLARYVLEHSPPMPGEKAFGCEML